MCRKYRKIFSMPEQIEVINYLDSIEMTGYYKKIENDGKICAIDQKNTYDILNVVSKCILNISKKYEYFSIRDFMDDEYSINIFYENTHENGKATLRKETFKEYDKIFGNTLETLSYTEVLLKKYDGIRRVYKIKNRKILEILANSMYASVAYLSHFIFLLVKDEDEIFRNIDKLITNPYNNNYKNDFKASTVNWLLKNSNRKSDSTQICKKIDNYLFYVFELNKYKSNKNNRNIKQSLKDLSYFRVHVRDKNKKYSLTRKEDKEIKDNNKRKMFKYDAIKNEIAELNKKINNSNLVHSEVNIYEPFELTSYHVHHILPKSYWDFSDNFNNKLDVDMPENLIIMNQTEHYDYAHLHGDTKTINEDNLLDILRKQYVKITDSLEITNNFYNLERFYLLLCKIFNLSEELSEYDEFIIKNIEEILYE